MTNWQPNLEGRSGPRYIAIADALATDLAAGRFKPGERLPTHRDLAWRLGVTVGTVSRAYAEAERRGLISGEVGRGTYVRGPDLTVTNFNFDSSDPPSAAIDLSTARPTLGIETARLGRTLAALAEDPQTMTLLGYQPHAGRPEHRAAGADWLSRRGLEVSPDGVVVTNGGNHGILTALAAAAKPGDRILAERLTYALLQPTIRMLGLRLEAVAQDREGLIPEAVEAACQANDVKALYCIPTIQNPTTATMSEARRRAIVKVAERHDLAILEDDIFALLAEAPAPPIASLAPDRTYYITSLSKTVAPGLRVGYVAPPADAVERVTDMVRASSVTAGPISAEIASRWIREGTADHVLEGHRREAVARRACVLELLGDWEIDCPAGSLHAWLQLPEPWRSAHFAAEAKRRGVLVAPAEAFAIGRREVPYAVRLGLGPPRDRAELETGLRRLADMLREGPSDTYGAIV